MSEKVVLITGSSEGIGRETAFKFAAEGYNVVITYRAHKKEAEETAKKCRKLGAPTVLVTKLDVLSDKSIQQCVKKVVKKFNHISVLINNAGVLVWNHFRKQSFKDIEWQVRTNVEGVMKMTLVALPYVKYMIINIASGAGKTAYDDIVPYCATKFAVRGFTQGLAQEIKIPVIAVNPGMTSTRMTKWKGVKPEKVAQVILNTAEGKYKVKSGGDVDVWTLL
ncbi:MAG TPA: SDR family oxidoreductase [Candidatus Nanoarchaeia archaeon]|nr:SDR family oxidoreductase [Candidatus Nanoarchaeia archaeon]